MAETTEVTPDTKMRFTATRKNVDVPVGLWLGCPGCNRMVYRKEMEEQLHCCPYCNHHFRVNARQRIEMLVDPGSFEERDSQLMASDPLGFKAKKAYAQQLSEARAATGTKDALISGLAYIKGRRTVLAVLDFSFLAGSMGTVVGEKLTRAIETATSLKLPIVVVSCSGGARMQESTLSLMQMAKTSAALARHAASNLLYISLLTDPTTGGVTASFAMLGDIIYAEPQAMIGFAGPRTIANTIRTELPEGFQRAEFLQEKGFIDRIVPRQELRSVVARAIDYCC
jgi:acetyl-CoA carboxylase carboxyl transferase subunit beta